MVEEVTGFGGAQQGVGVDSGEGDVDEVIELFRKLLGEPTTKKLMRWRGGDYYLIRFIKPRLNRLCTSGKCTLVEVFGGSGIVSQEADRDVFTNIIYNDIDSRLVELYRAVKEKPKEFMALLLVLPYGRFYYKLISKLLESGAKELAAIELAAFTFYVANAKVHGGLGNGGFSYGVVPDETHARWLKSYALAIPYIASKWADITIENLDFREVIDRYDRETTVFYLDPPYPDTADEYYSWYFTVHDLRDMAFMLRNIRGKFLLKLNERSYSYVSDLLPEHEYVIEKVEHWKFMDDISTIKRTGTNRKQITVFISSKTQ